MTLSVFSSASSPSLYLLWSGVLVFCPFFKLDCFFFYDWTWRFLIYSGYKSFIRYILYRYFLSIMACLFILNSAYCRAEVFNEVHFICSFTIVLLVSDLRNLCLIQGHKGLFLEVFTIPCFIFLGPFWVKWYTWYKVWILVHFYCIGYPVVPMPFVEKTVLSPLNCLCTCGSIFALSILFYWSVFLSWHQYHTVLQECE